MCRTQIFPFCWNPCVQAATLWVSYNRSLFSHHFEGWEVRGQGASGFSALVGPPSWLADDCLLVMSSHGRETGSLSSCFYKITNSITRASPT